MTAHIAEQLRHLAIPITSLVLDPSNARKHGERNLEAIKASLAKFGQRAPIVVQRDGMVVRSGNGRLLAAKALGWTEIAATIIDDDNATAAQFAIADNRTAELAEWDNETLALLLDGWDKETQEAVGFDKSDIDAVLADLEPPEIVEDEVPEPTLEPITKAGDLWLLGDHRLLCGDSTKAEAVARLMDGEKADVLLTDPPYNVAEHSRNFAADVSAAMTELAEAAWDKGFDIVPPLDNARKHCAESCTVYVWTSQFLIQTIWDHLSEWCDFTHYCVWAKPNPMPSLSKRHWTWNSELCAYGTRGSKRSVNFPDGEHAPSVWTFPKRSDGSHPTQKTVEVISHPMAFSSNPGQLVLDLFLGSGTTLIAAEQLGRKCYGMEISPQYCDVIVKRWETLTGKKAVLANG